jgi:hypothetical protein
MTAALAWLEDLCVSSIRKRVKDSRPKAVNYGNKEEWHLEVTSTIGQKLISK